MDQSTPQLGAPQDGPQMRSSIYAKQIASGAGRIDAVALGAVAPAPAPAGAVDAKATGTATLTVTGTATVN